MQMNLAVSKKIFWDPFHKNCTNGLKVYIPLPISCQSIISSFYIDLVNSISHFHFLLALKKLIFKTQKICWVHLLFCFYYSNKCQLLWSLNWMLTARLKNFGGWFVEMIFLKKFQKSLIFASYYVGAFLLFPSLKKCLVYFSCVFW